MALARVSDKGVLSIWQRMRKKSRRVRSVRPKYGIWQLVRISKEKNKFAKSAEQNYSAETFRIVKVIHSNHRPVYELEVMNKQMIKDQFYHDELTPVRITKRSILSIFPNR